MYVGECRMKETKREKEQCFVIMPISDQGDYPEGHFDKIYNQIFKPAIEEAGYEAYRVDENKICDSIMKKIFDALYRCPMAVCDLSNRNPNVLYELGIRQAYDKPVVLVQDDKTDKIFDISGINTVYYKSNRLYENILDARKKITEAIMSTKDGKENSIIKIWQAMAADISYDAMTREDKLEIMIRSMMNDIQELKMDKRNNIENYETYFNIMGDERNLKKSNIVDSIFIELQPGITKKEIEIAIKNIERQCKIPILWKIRNGKLYTNLEPEMIGNVACMNELNKLGIVCL
jgi:hypothetical protein